MKTSFSIEVLIIAALICPAGSSAQWTPTSGPTYLNPIGFLSVAVQGDTILAGGYQGGGIFRSTDDGHTWTEVLSTGYVYSLTVYHEFVYAGNYAGIYRSSDFGETWVSSSSGLPDQVNVNVTSIAGKDSFLFAGTDFGVYRSGDSGSTWTSMSNGLTPVFGSRTVFSIVASQGVLLAATYDGVYRSSDDGQSWSSSNSGIPTYGNGSHYDVRSFLVDGIYVFAGTSGIYRSRENGLNWVAENSGLPINGSNPYFQMVYSLARSGNRILAGTDQSGVYVSTDDGGTWNAMLHSPPSYAYVFGFAVRSTDVFAATLGGIFRIGISDTDWTPVLTGYTRVASTFALGSTATKLLVSGNGGTYSSTDGGAHWPRIDSIPGDPTFNHFATAGSLIYASSNSHIHRSSDGGLTWTVSDSGINSYFINSVITKGTDVFAVSGFDGQFGEFGGVFRSTDQGISWFRAGLKDTAVLSLMPLGEDLFVGTLHGIF